jgi:hypothetical protein
LNERLVSCELFFWVDEVEWERLGNLTDVRRVPLSDGTIELRLVDRKGNLVRAIRDDNVSIEIRGSDRSGGFPTT